MSQFIFNITKYRVKIRLISDFPTHFRLAIKCVYLEGYLSIISQNIFYRIKKNKIKRRLASI